MATPWFKKAKRAAQERGITQVHLSKIVGKSQPIISQWLSGQRDPSTDDLRKLAEALGMSLSELFGEDARYVDEKREMALLDLFRELPDERRETALALIKALKPEKG